MKRTHLAEQGNLMHPDNVPKWRCVRPQWEVLGLVGMPLPDMGGGGGGRTVRCAKSRLFLTTGSHGSQSPAFCTLQPLLVHQGFFVLVWCLPWVPGSWIVHPRCCFEVGGWFAGVFRG